VVAPGRVAGTGGPAPPHRPGTGQAPASRRMICRFRGSYGGMLTFIIILILVGLVAGAVARLVVPGRDPMGILGTIVLGIVGSFVGGFIWNLIQYHRLAPHKFHLAGIIGSILGAILVLILLRMTGMERGRRRVYR
jgi:uncharacterized membrane protein YeaQ/YmgE (transglycosylase-associated protein family)